MCVLFILPIFLIAVSILMATKGLKKPKGRAVSLSFDEGVVGEVGRLSELINLADIREHP